MNIKYMDNLPKEDLNNYISTLINKIYSILPLYEEQGKTDSLISKTDGIIRNVDGFLCICPIGNSAVSLDILSYLQKLKHFDTHKDVKSCVFKVCNLLSDLKVGD